MPDRVYLARNHPPNLWDRVSAHWMEITLALLGIIRGTLTIVGDKTPHITAAIDRIPSISGLLVSLSLAVGGFVWIYSVLKRFKTLNEYYLRLRTGLAMVFLGWTSYFVVAIAFRPEEALTWTVTLFASLGTFGLYIQTFVNEKTIRKGGRRE